MGAVDSEEWVGRRDTSQMSRLTLRRYWASPLVEREMGVAARRWTTYWGRVTLLLFALAPVVVAYAAGKIGITGSGLMSSGLGAELLMVQAGLLFFWVVLAAIQLASDAISSEKREGTLGLLFLTSLTPFEIVTGKLAAASMRTWHGLLAVIPAVIMARTKPS